MNAFTAFTAFSQRLLINFTLVFFNWFIHHFHTNMNLKQYVVLSPSYYDRAQVLKNCTKNTSSYCKQLCLLIADKISV